MKEIIGSIVKIACFIVILPLIFALIMSFQGQVLILPVKKEAWLLWGAGSYVALNLFVYDLESVFTFGNAFIEKLLPVFKVGKYVLPVYSILLTVIFAIVSAVNHGTSLQPCFLFAIAFTLAMHLF